MCDELKGKFLESLLECRELVINKEINDDLVESVILRIKQWNDDDDIAEAESKSYNRNNNPIKIYINTPGGCAASTMSCVGMIMSSKTPVHTYVLGKAYSGGFFIAIAGHKRFAQPFSRYMYHQLGYGTHGELQVHQETLEFEILTQALLEDFILKQTKIPKKKLEEVRKAKIDWYFYACEEMAKKYKIFDEFF